MIQSVAALISSGKQIFDQYLEVFLFSQEILKRVQIISRFFYSLVFYCVYLQFGSSWYQVLNSLLIPIILTNFKKAGTVTSLDFKPCNILCNNSVLLPWSLLSLVLIEKARMEMIQLQRGDFSDQQGIPHSHQAYQQKRAVQAGLKLKIPKGMCVCVCYRPKHWPLFVLRRMRPVHYIASVDLPPSIANSSETTNGLASSTTIQRRTMHCYMCVSSLMAKTDLGNRHF